MNKNIVMQFFVVIVFSFLLGLTFNSFVIPNGLVSGGVTGVSMILNNFISLDSGIINLLLNAPILIIGYLKLGRKFMLLTITAVVTLSVSMSLLPVSAFVDDLMLSAVFGGVIAGFCLGMIFKFSASSGGFDIISLIILLKKDISLGLVSLSLNFIVVFVSGFIFGWEAALYTMLFIYVSSKMIDQIHTSNVKITLTIITDKGEEMESLVLERLKRGITVMEGRGSFTDSEKSILYMVITRYELTDMKQLIKEVDSKAFVNISPTLEIFGNFKNKK